MVRYNCVLRSAWLPLLAIAAVGQVNPALAQTYKVIYSFTDDGDGARPIGGVISDAFGNLYGETEYGGIDCDTGPGTLPAQAGCGTVYKIDPSGALTTLVTFDKANGAFGDSALTLIGSTLYGTAYSGGPNDAGLLFSLSTDGSHFRVLHRFDGRDGSGPDAALLAGPNGVAYGVTRNGAAGYGVLFELKPDSTYTILHTFTAGADGGQPNSIILAPSGVIFGGADAGGVQCTGYGDGCGVVFQYDPKTGLFTVLHTAALKEGYEPILGSLGTDGTLYGANRYGGPGGTNNSYGTLFSLGTTGEKKFSVLTDFTSSTGDYPMSGPLLNADGSLSGTTYEGSTGFRGTLYHYAAGVLTTEYSFGAHPGQGTYPESQPIAGGSGSLIGTAAAGGPQHPYTYGTIYRVGP